MSTHADLAVRNKAKARKREFGDFQTPDSLAYDVCDLLARSHKHYASIVEPTCGVGAMLFAALARFPTAGRGVGFEINADYVEAAKGRLVANGGRKVADIKNADFFAVDWQEQLEQTNDPLLIIGNPPWVNSAELGRLDSTNLPAKANTEKLRGIEAITGRSNFDICEAVLRVLIDAVTHRDCTIAMLCKKSVARRVLQYCWKSNIAIDLASIYDIDSRKHFGASVDACLFVIEFKANKNNSTFEAHCFGSFVDLNASQKIGWCDDRLVSELGAYNLHSDLLGPPPQRWRSGVKHDCIRVMELRYVDGAVVNGFDEIVDIESDYLYPMLKGSQVGGTVAPDRFMIVTQQAVGESTDAIEHRAPRTWQYLSQYRELFDQRRSRIYRDKPDFSIFGVGPYSFAPYKVAISSLHRTMQFHVVESQDGKPTMLDDTAYFLPLETPGEAQSICRAMNSESIQSLLRSLTFPDAKRTVTAGLLNQCDYSKVAVR